MIRSFISKTVISMSLLSAFAGTMTLTAIPGWAVVPAWGVNGPNANTADLNAIFQVLRSRGVTQYRVNVNLTDDTNSYEVPMYQEMVGLAKTYGITLKPILFTAFTWGDRTDHGKYPAGDRSALYLQGFFRTYNFVSQFKNDINDWEMENELNLLVHDSNGSPLYGQGWTADEFNTPLMNDWASVLRGMSDAIDLINSQSGTHLRRTLNTTSTMFGFLDFMTSQNVRFEVISYHYYEGLGTNPHNYWGGVRPNFDLFQQLASYNKSVVFNEVNAAEIYNSSYENQVGQPVTEKGFKSLDAILDYLNTQTSAKIEYVGLYELLDEPAKAPPENRFGLMYNTTTPKISLYLLSYFAGGALSPDEQQELINRGFIP